MPEQEHKYDVLEEGDEIPFRNDYAEVVVRQVVEEIPDYLPTWATPDEFDPPERDDLDADYVLLTIDTPDGESYDTTATGLVTHLGETYDEHGMPSVRTRVRDALGVGTGMRISVNSPAVGSRDLDADEARRLARFLRTRDDFEPLYVLIGRADSPEDMHEIADALDRAADVMDVAAKVE